MMNNHIATVVATLTLLLGTTGCSGMKHFLFGRGAACGACAATTPTYGIAPPAEPVCGYELDCGRELACGYEPALIKPFGRLGSRLHGGYPTCNCGPGAQSYMPSGVDAYYDEVHDPYAYGGEVIGSQVIGDSYNGYPGPGTILSETVVPGSVYPGVTTQDNFDARGNRILSAEPLPGTVTQP